MRNFRELDIWHFSRKLTKDVYILTGTFPSTEIYGLSSQLRRASISVVSNIAEGCSRSSEVEFARFLEIALGSAFEIESQIILAGDLEFIGKESCDVLIERLQSLQRQISSFRISVLKRIRDK